MFFILSKTIPFLLQPCAIIALLFLAYFIFHSWRKRKYLLWASVFFFILFSNEFIANKLLINYQVPPKSVKKVDHHHYGVLLTGMTNTLMEPEENVYFNHNADRLLQALPMIFNNKIDTLIISGGGATALRKDIKEARVIESYLKDINFPLDRLKIEDSSRNTYESGKFISKMLKGKEVILITSASHMKRAQAVFNKQGIKSIAFPTVYLTNNKTLSPSMFIPSGDAILKWNILFKE